MKVNGLTKEGIMETLTNKKITKATFKSFVNRNRENLYFIPHSSFDGMIDGIRKADNMEPRKAEVDPQGHIEHSLGIRGVWLVGHSGDWFKSYEDETFKGIEVSNSCGSFKVVIKKGL